MGLVRYLLALYVLLSLGKASYDRPPWPYHGDGSTNVSPALVASKFAAIVTTKALLPQQSDDLKTKILSPVVLWLVSLSWLTLPRLQLLATADDEPIFWPKATYYYIFSGLSPPIPVTV